MKEFKDKVAVITGAASGIGLGIAELCARKGMHLVLADIDEAGLAVAEERLRVQGVRVIAMRTDVAKRADVEELARCAFASFGAVHLLFNNAGVAAGGVAWEATWNDWEWVIGVNVWGLIHGVKVFTPRMDAQKSECHIVNTASGAGLTVGGFSAPYAVTKHAAVALSECMYTALEQRKSLVKVSVLCPGLVRTNIADVERSRPAEMRNESVVMTPEMEAGRAALRNLVATSMAPERVAEMVFDAIEREQFYILTDPRWKEVVQLRTDRLLRMENPLNPGATIAKLLSGGGRGL